MQGNRGGKRQKKKTPKTDEDDAGFDKEHDYMEEYIKKNFGTKSIGLAWYWWIQSNGRCGRRDNTESDDIEKDVVIMQLFRRWLVNEPVSLSVVLRAYRIFFTMDEIGAFCLNMFLCHN